MTDVFEFQLTDFKVLRELEIDETVQREERVRFYTLEEQTVDVFEKLLPKGRSTRFQRDALAREVDKLKDLYSTYIVPTAVDYEIRDVEYGKRVSWVIPVYANNRATQYSFSQSYAPFFEEANIKLPGFYNRFLGALPKPYRAGQEGFPYSMDTPEVFVSSEGKDPIRALPNYKVPRTQLHEDGSYDVILVPRDNTADTVNFTGYYIQDRPLEIPNPLAEHPFLKSNKASYLETNQPLKDVFPSLGAILEHAVPVTSDPYYQAAPFLKLYDVKLNDIPWNMWKVKFPPAESLDKMPMPADLAFPVPTADAPSEKLTEMYDTKYYAGLASRYWLMNQVDGGELLIKLLLTQAIEHGSVQSIPLVDLPKLAFPDTTPDECLLTGKNFQEFQVQGNLRRRLEETKTKEWKSKYECVPMDFVRQERKMLGYKHRKQWRENEAVEILKEYMRAMMTYRMPKKAATKFIADTKTPARNDSAMRRDVVAILDDVERYPEDKARDIAEIVKSATITKNIYSDLDGLFVLCRHTLVVLEGQLAQDPKAFHEEWTASEAGYRVCKFCGERVIAENFVEQDEYNDEGFVVKRTMAMEQQTFHSESLSNFTTGLRALTQLFITDAVSESLLLLILSLLQVLPEKEQLEPLLQLVRTLDKNVDKLKDPEDKKNRLHGMIGMAGAVILLQSHVPTLVPRRSFGPTALNLSGYPRDAAEPEKNTIVDTLMMIVRKTVEQFPTSFKIAALPAIRSMMNNSSSFRDGVNKMITRFIEKPFVVNALNASKAHIGKLPPKEEPKTLLPVLAPPEKLGVIGHMDLCEDNEAFWKNVHPPQYTQPAVPLRVGIRASQTRVDLMPTSSDRVAPKTVTTAEIREVFKQGVPAVFKKLVVLKDGWRTNLAIATRLSDLFEVPIPVREVDTSQNKDDLRDYAKGLVYVVLNAIKDNDTKRDKFLELWRTDTTLYSLMSDVNEERRQSNTIRAMERKTFTDRMRMMSDKEREITQELLRINMAPFIISTKDRVLFAQTAEEQQEARLMARLEGLIVEEEDAGVGAPRDFEDEDQDQDVDHGDYGDYNAVPGNDGRDYVQPQLYDDPDTSI